MKRFEVSAEIEHLDSLLIVFSTERGGNQRLCFASGERVPEPWVRGSTPTSQVICRI